MAKKAVLYIEITQDEMSLIEQIITQMNEHMKPFKTNKREFVLDGIRQHIARLGDQVHEAATRMTKPES